MHFKANCGFGKHTGQWKVALEGSENLQELEVEVTTSFEEFSVFYLKTGYKSTAPNQENVGINLRLNNHTYLTDCVVTTTDGGRMINLSGSVDAFGIDGSAEIEFKQDEDAYEFKFTSKMTDYESYYFVVSLDKQHIEVNLKQGTAEIISAELNFRQIVIRFSWKEKTFFNLTANYSPLDSGLQFDLSINSSETRPVTLDLTYSYADGHEGRGHITVGETRYKVDARANLRKKGSSLELHVESSASPHTPITFKAMYNVRDFLKGKMRSMMDLGSVFFEWGDHIELTVTGMHSGKNVKLNVDISTPFKFLPKLRLGYDGEFSLKKSNVNFTFTAFAEWSEKVTVTGFVKHKNGKVDLLLTLTTTYPDLEKLSASFKFNSGHIDTTLVFNTYEWNILCDYELYPFSVKLSTRTPVKGLENLSFATDISLQNGVFSCLSELTWQGDRSVRLNVKAELWSLMIELNTPWKPVREASFSTSLRTESEELMYQADLQWDERKTGLSFILSPSQMKLVGRFDENDVETGLARIEYLLNRKTFDFEVEVRTPYDAFRSLELEYHLRSKEHGINAKFDVNRMTNSVDGSFSVKGGKLRIDIPVLGDLVWTMEASKKWLQMDTETTFVYSKSAAPLTFSLNYHIQPDEQMISLNSKFEAEDLSLELVEFSTTAHYTLSYGFIESIHESSTLLTKMESEQPVESALNFTLSYVDDQVLITLKSEENYFDTSVSVSCKIPVSSLEGVVELIVSQDEEQVFKFLFESVVPDARSSRLLATLEVGEWTAEARVTLTGETLDVAFSYPDRATKHTLSLKWPERIGLEKFSLEAKVDSPYIAEEGFEFNVHFETQDKFSYALDSTVSYGPKNIDLRGIIQYRKKQRQVKVDLEVTSAWVGDHSLEVDVQWLKDITAELILKSGDKQHSIQLFVDVNNYSAELTCNSSWLPYEDIALTGKVNAASGSSDFEFEGQLTGTTDNDIVLINVKFTGEGIRNVTSSISVTQNRNLVFELTGSAKVDETGVSAKIRGKHYDPDVGRTTFGLTLTDNDEKRYFHLYVEEYYSTIFDITVDSTKHQWRENQRFNVQYRDYKVSFRTLFRPEEGHIYLFTGMNDVELNNDFSYDLQNKTNISFRTRTSFPAVREFKIQLTVPDSRNDKPLEIYLITDEHVYSLDVYSYPDSVMGRSIKVSLTTPFKGYEKFVIHTPQFAYKNNIFTVMLEYPGMKTGVVLRSESLSYLNSDMQISVYLPFEEYPIISLKHFTGRRDRLGLSSIEVRVGKVGITLSASYFYRRPLTKIEAFVQINEFNMKAVFTAKNPSRNSYSHKLYLELSPQPYIDARFYLAEFTYHSAERISLSLSDNIEDILKLHFEWADNKVFAIATPKRYPGYMILHLESTEKLNNYHMEVGLMSHTRPWEVYGLQVTQEALEAGQHLSLYGEAAEQQISIEGKFSADALHFTDSLTFEMNRKRIGYEVLFQKKPSLFSDDYVGDVWIMVPSHVVHFNTSATSSAKKFDMLTSFNWNELNPDTLPLNLAIHYDDQSLFWQEDHQFSVIFSHPAVKDIVLQGNVSRAGSSPLHGLAELVDENSPERKVLMSFVVHPESDVGERNMMMNISQPFSGMGLVMDAQIMKSVFNRANYNLKYWSLTEEKWNDLKVSTAVNTIERGYDFSAAVTAPQNNWGYSYEGSVESWKHAARLSIQGSSDRYGDFWKFGASVNKFMPELLVHLDVGQKDDGEEAYEEGRLRIGLQNPVEMGVILDHRKFGETVQDGSVSLKLQTPDLLQFVIEFDPSLDYSDDHFWARLTSPADKIASAWWRDLTFTASSVTYLLRRESPTALDVLVDKQTLWAIWTTEVTRYVEFLEDATYDLNVMTDDLLVLWQQSLQPMLMDLHYFASNA